MEDHACDPRIQEGRGYRIGAKGQPSSLCFKNQKSKTFANFVLNRRLASEDIKICFSLIKITQSKNRQRIQVDLHPKVAGKQPQAQEKMHNVISRYRKAT